MHLLSHGNPFHEAPRFHFLIIPLIVDHGISSRYENRLIAEGASYNSTLLEFTELFMGVFPKCIVSQLWSQIQSLPCFHQFAVSRYHSSKNYSQTASQTYMVGIISNYI